MFHRPIMAPRAALQGARFSMTRFVGNSAGGSAGGSAGNPSGNSARNPPPGYQTSKGWKYAKRTATLVMFSPFAFMGYYAYQIYRENNPAPQAPQSTHFANGNKKKTLVILGTGWGAISLLKKLDTTLYNVVVVSPRNYFLFTPLLPSCPTGTVEYRSVMESVRSVVRRTPGEVLYYEAEATDVDPENNRITLKQKVGGDEVEIEGLEAVSITLDYDYLVMAVGAKTNTFGIPGVEDHACFLKELPDSQRIRKRFMHCIETAKLHPQGSKERQRLLHTVVVGGGPTGVEFAAELQDYIHEDIRKWDPEIATELRVSIIEGSPNPLGMMSKDLISYTRKTLVDLGIDLRTSLRVKSVNDTAVHTLVTTPQGQEWVDIPYGLLVWATGNGTRDIVTNLSSKIPHQKNATRGLLVDDQLRLHGSQNIYALGDCTFTKNPPTAQVANQEGIFLARLLETLARVDHLQYELYSAKYAGSERERVQYQLQHAKAQLRPFQYDHKGTLAYIGSERAVADLAGGWGTGSLSHFSSGGSFTFLVWKSAYVSMLMSTKTQVLVTLDWFKVFLFGRDVSRE